MKIWVNDIKILLQITAKTVLWKVRYNFGQLFGLKISWKDSGIVIYQLSDFERNGTIDKYSVEMLDQKI